MHSAVEKPYHCKVCDSSFAQIKSLYSHNKTHHPGSKPYTCHLCDYTAARSGNLIEHIKKHSGDNPFICKDCGFSFAQVKSLYSHIGSHHPKSKSNASKGEKTKESSLSSGAASGSSTHVKTHTGEKPYVCKICGSAFAQIKALCSHKKTHGKVTTKSRSCMLCSFKCSKIRELRTHETLKHMDIKTFICKHCNTEFKTPQTLKKHQLIQCGEPQSCKLCSFESCNKAAFEMHSNTHEPPIIKDRNFNCKICKSKFLLSADLESHEKICSEPQKCTVCKYVATNRKSLRLHERKHTGDMNYICEVCSYMSRDFKSFKTHQRMHIEAKKYTCKICSYVTNLKRNLTSHEKTHKIYTCNICNATFTLLSNLKTHKTTHIILDLLDNDISD